MKCETTGEQRFYEEQNVEEVSHEITHDRHLPRSSGQGHGVVIGSWSKQEFFHIGHVCVALGIEQSVVTAQFQGDQWECHGLIDRSHRRSTH